MNLIHHQYDLDEEGMEIHSNKAGLTPEEQADARRIYSSPTAEPGDDEKIAAIRRKWDFVDNLPHSAFAALPSVLPRRIEPGSAAERFMAERSTELH